MLLRHPSTPSTGGANTTDASSALPNHRKLWRYAETSLSVRLPHITCTACGHTYAVLHCLFDPPMEQLPLYCPYCGSHAKPEEVSHA